MPLVKKATGNYHIKSNSLGKLMALSVISATLEIEKAMQFFLHGTSLSATGREFTGPILTRERSVRQ